MEDCLGLGLRRELEKEGAGETEACIQGTWWQTVLEPSNPSSYHPQSSALGMKSMGTMPGNHKISGFGTLGTEIQ